MRKGIFNCCLALLLALFSYTATAKWLDFPSFFFDMHNQRIPQPFVIPVSLFLLLLETYIPAGILFEKFRASALITALSLFTVFTVYSLFVLSHVFANTPCSCGGILKGLSWPQHLFFNLFFLSIAGWCLYYWMERRFYQQIHA